MTQGAKTQKPEQGKAQQGQSRASKMHGTTVTLAHGAGGRSMQALIDEIFLAEFGTQHLSDLNDSARIEAGSNTLAFTTDSFVIDPIFFPGGNIGKLAVCGTVNDLAVSGAKPVALSFSVIVEEGFKLEDLKKIARSAKIEADIAGVSIVTGDTKVVNRGGADGIFINTAGIGEIQSGLHLSPKNISAGDRVLVSNSIGEHGAAIMVARDDLGLETELISDCRCLVSLCTELAQSVPGLKAMRDATRGGVAAVLNEFAQASGTAIFIDEASLPLKPEVRGVSEILGLDPLYLANEGLFVAVVSEAEADAAVAALQKLPGGESATLIGEVRADPSGVLVMNAMLGGQRLVDMPDGDQMPRIC